MDDDEDDHEEDDDGGSRRACRNRLRGMRLTPRKKRVREQ
jgi:hypothetical protein